MPPELRQLALRLRDQGGVLGVQVGARTGAHRVALHRHAEGVAPVVEDPNLAAVGLRLPEDVPRHVHAGDVLLDLVVAPADPVVPDHVRHRVAAAAVVERVCQLGPDVHQVRQVGVVQRLHQLVGDQVHDVRAGQAHDHVERDRARGQLRDRLLRRVVGRDLHLRRRQLLELLDRDGVDVVGVVVDAAAGRPRPGGRRRSACCRSVIAHVTELSMRGSGSPPGPVGFWTTRLRGLAARTGSLRADRRGGVLASGQHPGHAQPDGRAHRPGHELAPAYARSVLRMRHLDSPLS